jgi:nitrate reductase / nitrite oxidoreductase, alpha subunit
VADRGLRAGWVRPPRQQAATPWFYLASDQWRYEGFDAGELAARLGWTPAHPTFDRNPLDLAEQAAAAGLAAGDYVVRELREGRLRFATEDPDAPENVPRVLTV